MREISIHNLEKPEPKKDEALKKIAEGLEVLAKMNIDMSEAILEAVKSQPRQESVDVEAIVKPLVETLSKKHSASSYTFNIKRNSANLMTSVEAVPNEP